MSDECDSFYRVGGGVENYLFLPPQHSMMLTYSFRARPSGNISADSGIMRVSVFIHPLLRVGLSPIHGWGVFAGGDLPRGLVVERSPVLTISHDLVDPPDVFYNYRFGWPEGAPWTEYVLGLGYSSLYNHSSSPNVKWSSELGEKLLVFETLRDIKEGEELTSFYGLGYNWGEGEGDLFAV